MMNNMFIKKWNYYFSIFTRRSILNMNRLMIIIMKIINVIVYMIYIFIDVFDDFFTWLRSYFPSAALYTHLRICSLLAKLFHKFEYVCILNYHSFLYFFKITIYIPIAGFPIKVLTSVWSLGQISTKGFGQSGAFKSLPGGINREGGAIVPPRIRSSVVQVKRESTNFQTIVRITTEQGEPSHLKAHKTLRWRIQFIQVSKKRVLNLLNEFVIKNF